MRNMRKENENTMIIKNLFFKISSLTRKNRKLPIFRGWKDPGFSLIMS